MDIFMECKINCNVQKVWTENEQCECNNFALNFLEVW